MPTIEVIVSPSGETKVQTKGYAGGACRQASQFLEEAMGQRASEQLTSEFYQNQAVAQRIAEDQR